MLEIEDHLVLVRSSEQFQSELDLFALNLLLNMVEGVLEGYVEHDLLQHGARGEIVAHRGDPLDVFDPLLQAALDP